MEGAGGVGSQAGTLPVAGGGEVAGSSGVGCGGRVASVAVRVGGVGWARSAARSAVEVLLTMQRDSYSAAGRRQTLLDQRRPGKIGGVSARGTSLALSAALVACTPEPASTVELRQTVVELVDQGRAMAMEDAMAALVGRVSAGDTLPEIADAVAEQVASALDCAEVEALGSVALRITFGSAGLPCALEGVGYVGTLRVVYTRPSAETLLATLYYEPLRGDETALDGFTQLTWDEGGITRVVTEIRADTAMAREVEIQSDRLVAFTGGARKVDGWRRWQTLMGRWEMDLAGLDLEPSAALPRTGLASVETPFNHTLVADFSATGEAFEVRINGGRRDRLFEVDASGAVIDLGDG